MTGGRVYLVGDDDAVFTLASVLVLIQRHGDQATVADLIGVAPSTITRFLQRHGVSQPRAARTEKQEGAEA